MLHENDYSKEKNRLRFSPFTLRHRSDNATHLILEMVGHRSIHVIKHAFNSNNELLDRLSRRSFRNRIKTYTLRHIEYCFPRYWLRNFSSQKRKNHRNRRSNHTA